jgi:hypothetical protein
MKDFMSTNEEEVRDQTLKSEDAQLMMEEAHYVELIVVYGWDKVTSDLRSAMGEKQW